jgi:hypothetical protein
MKTKRRQELRTNELIMQLMRIKDYAVQHWNRIAGAAVVVVLLIAIIAYWQYSRSARRTEGLNAIAKLREDPNLTPMERLEKMEQIAGQYSDKQVERVALETIGESAMMQVLIGPASDEPSQRDKLLDMAHHAFTRIVTEFPDRYEAVARARLGLAAIAEDRGNKDEAAREYKAILDNPKLAAIKMYESIAATREKTLDERMRPVVILPATRPAATQATTVPSATRAATRPTATSPARRPLRLTPTPATRPVGAR